MLFYLVILQLDMPSIVNNHGRLAPSEQKQRTNGSEWGGGGNGKRKRRGNCAQDLITRYIFIKQNP